MRFVFVTRVVVCLSAVIAVAMATPVGVTGQVRDSPVDLVQTQLNAPGKVTVGKKFRIMDEVESVGEQQAGNSVTYFYLSKDDTIDPADLVIAARRTPPLSPGRTSFEPTQIQLPEKVEPGAYYLIARCNATRAVVERYWDNNVRAVKITVEPAKNK
jgi:hypothetical protein